MIRYITLSLITSILFAASTASAQSFTGIGDVDMSNGANPEQTFLSKAFGISADGSTVFGVSVDGSFLDGSGATLSLFGVAPITYTESEGLNAINVVQDNFNPSFDRYGAFGASADGNVILGTAGGETLSSVFQYTRDSDTLDQQFLIDAADSVSTRNTADNGSTILLNGVEDSGGFQNRIWDLNTSTVTFPNGTDRFVANLTGDGIPLGRASMTFGGTTFPAKWAIGGGDPIFLDTLAEGTAIDGSPDGDVVVGGSDNIAFTWTESTGLISLGDLPGGDFDSFATETSADGSAIVGYGNDADGRKPVIWIDGGAPQTLEAFISDSGIDLTGWSITDVTGISDSGNDIVGWGTNPDGNTEGFVFRIPEPATALMLALPMAALSRRRR